MLCSSLMLGIRQSRYPAWPHKPLPMFVQSVLLVQEVVSSPSHLLLRVSRKTVKAEPVGAMGATPGGGLLQENVRFTPWIPFPVSFTSHIKSELLSVAVPSPW